MPGSWTQRFRCRGRSSRDRACHAAAARRSGPSQRCDVANAGSDAAAGVNICRIIHQLGDDPVAARRRRTNGGYVHNQRGAGIASDGAEHPDRGASVRIDEDRVTSDPRLPGADGECLAGHGRRDGGGRRGPLRRGLRGAVCGFEAARGLQSVRAKDAASKNAGSSVVTRRPQRTIGADEERRHRLDAGRIVKVGGRLNFCDSPVRAPNRARRDVAGVKEHGVAASCRRVIAELALCVVACGAHIALVGEDVHLAGCDNDVDRGAQQAFWQNDSAGEQEGLDIVAVTEARHGLTAHRNAAVLHEESGMIRRAVWRGAVEEPYRPTTR
jgi:hypothetical protein